MEWTDEWTEPFKLECPDCGDLVEAREVIEIGPRHVSRRPAEQASSHQ
jgi:hypothetical protein